jgi:UDP-N-acetyl-D-glucosamine dehydrogenase
MSLGSQGILTMTTLHADQLLAKIRAHDALVCVIGLGYVGLPLALAFVEKGFVVLGFDVDPDKVAKLNRGEGYIKHLDGGRIAAAVATGRFTATADFTRLGEADAVLICVPTPLTPQREPDMTYVDAAAHQIRATLRPGQLIILESTTYPGATDERLCSILEATSDSACHPGEARRADEGSSQTGTGHPACGLDFFLAFSPEREDPGNKNYGTTNTPKVVGGVDQTSGDLAQALYDQIIAKTVRVSSARAAEATKLMENIFRAVNIALVNELKIVYDRMGIDIWEVLDAASTKPFGFMRFNPGPGWGGHCIPLDPFYLSWKARQYGASARFIELAGEVNINMPRYVVGKLIGALNERGKAVKGSKILILGIAYKRDIDDDRESPGYEIVTLLEILGAQVDYHDPHVPIMKPTRRHPGTIERCSISLTRETLAVFDAAVVVTDHSGVDYPLIGSVIPIVIDTRGVFRQSGLRHTRA